VSMYPETLAHVLAKLEPDAGFDGCAHDSSFTPERRAAISSAISLRRIADFICGSASNCDVVAYVADEFDRRSSRP
jgi:hypothetical protein